MQAIVNQYYPVEEQNVSYAEDKNSAASIEDLTRQENAIEKDLASTSVVDARECKSY